MKPFDASSFAITSRPFRDEVDFRRIRVLCERTYPVTGLGWNWDVRRWDGARYYDANPELNPDWERTIHLWERGDGSLAGVVNQDGAGWFYLQLDPTAREIEDEMIAWAEANLAAPAEGGKRQVQTEVWEYDEERQRILEQRGYEKMPYGGMIRRLRFGDRPLPAVEIAEGYTLRPIRHDDREDCRRLADLLNAAFNRSFHNLEEFYQFSHLAPCFRQDLHLVAEAPDGAFEAHAALIYDAGNRRGLYEPVCTHPGHRRKGLAQALMFELMRRLKALGAAEVTVETGDAIPANALYNAMGFTEAYKSFAWKKVW